MLDGLAGILAHIGDDAVAVVEALLLGELCDDREHMAQQSAVSLSQRSGRGDVLFRDDEEMHLGLRGDVVECHHLLVLIELLRGVLPRCNFAKQTIFHGNRSFLLSIIRMLPHAVKPLSLGEVSAKQTERAKALTGDPKHSDIIALPKAPAYRAAAALGPQACPLSHLR